MTNSDKVCIYSQLLPKTEKLMDDIRAEKTEQGKTTQQLIDATGVPKATLDRFFAGTLKRPGFYDICALCICLGIPIEERLGIAPQGDPSEAEQLRVLVAHQKELLDEKEKEILLLQERSEMQQSGIATRDGHIKRQAEDLRRKDTELAAAWKGDRPLLYALCGLCAMLAAVLLVYITLDARNPSKGFIRSTGVSVVVWVGVGCIMALLALLACVIAVRRKAKEGH